MNPKVTVLMSVNNGAKYLSEAIESILDQSFGNFEFLVIDDGSTDSSASIIEACSDSRIVLVRNEENLGLTRSLNKGLGLARGKYIARMDADDIALPQRLARQVAFLEDHPEIGLLGTAYWVIDASGQRMSAPHRLRTPLEVQWGSLSTCPFAHPTVMIRNEILIDHRLLYDERFSVAQDYDLWVRLLRHTDGANLEEPLLERRVHRASVTNQHWKIQRRNHVTVSFRAIGDQLPDFRVKYEQIELMHGLWFAQESVFRTQRIPPAEAAGVYLDLFDAFRARYGSRSDVGLVARGVARRLLRPVASNLLSQGMLRIALRLLVRYPALPVMVLQRAAVATERLRRRLMAKVVGMQR